MSDIRDTNHDGKVSLMEKVKDKLHIGGHKDTHTSNAATTHTTGTSYHTAAPVAVPIGNPMPMAGAMPIAGAMPMAGAMPLAGAHDSRDLNRDGYVSTGEKLQSSAHLGSNFNDSRDLNRDGHISTSEKLASAAGSRGALSDSRDLNRDGHISASERLASSGSGFHDSRDLNRDGHVSASERMASSQFGSREHEEAHLKLHEEQLAISKREVGAGEVDIHKRVQQETVQQTIPVRREEVTIERHALTGAPSPNARIASQDEVVRVPLFREEVVTEKRIVPTEEVIVRKKEVMENQTVGATLRSEYVETTQLNSTFDARDTNRDGHVSMGEKFHTQGAYGDIRDTNRDGHVSMGEKLKGAALPAAGGSAYGDARDTNHDGHVSMGEKLKGAALPAAGRAARG